MMKFSRNILFVIVGGILSYLFGNFYNIMGIGETYAMWLSTLSLILFVIGVFGLFVYYPINR